MKKPSFRGVKRWAIIFSIMLLASLLLAACGEPDHSILAPAGPVADRERSLFFFILGVATFIFVVVEAVLIYFIFRYRERPNSPAAMQIHGNNRVEIIWTVAPSIFLFAVLAYTVYTMVTLYPTNPSLEVRVVGHQWWWEFDYPNQHIVTADTLHIPAGAVVRADLFSDNVIHSFWIPAITGKTDVVPGHNNVMVFEADSNQAGKTFFGACAEYCGTQHAHMRFDVVVDPPDVFNTWISTQQQAAQAPTSGSLAAKGKQIFAQQCVGCHGIVGVNLTSYDDPKTKNLVGPNLTHFGSRGLIAGAVLTNTPDNLAKWLSDPQSVKPGNDMMVSLNQDQINALVAYLESLK